MSIKPYLFAHPRRVPQEPQFPLLPRACKWPLCAFRFFPPMPPGAPLQCRAPLDFLHIWCMHASTLAYLTSVRMHACIDADFVCGCVNALSRGGGCVEKRRAFNKKYPPRSLPLPRGRRTPTGGFLCDAVRSRWTNRNPTPPCLKSAEVACPSCCPVL